MELRNYTNIPEQETKVFGASGKYSHKNNTYNGKYHPNLDNIAPSFNAIEIDWNGYNTGTKVINNTVDFLDWIEKETEKIRPSFSQEAGHNSHYTPTAYNGSINIPISIDDNTISVDYRSTNIPIDNYGHFLINSLPKEFGYLYIGDGECANDIDVNHTIHNHVNQDNFKQLADMYYYPAYINKTAIKYTVDKNHEYGDDDFSGTIHIVIKKGYKWDSKNPENSDFEIYVRTVEPVEFEFRYTGELELFDTCDEYNFFKLNGVEDGKDIRLVLKTDAPLR